MTTPMRPFAVGFIGAGNMAEALTSGILAAGRIAAGRILASEPNPERAAAFARATGVQTTASNAEVADGCETVVLAVKPQALDAVLADVGARLGPAALVVSIVAGATTRRIESRLPPGARVVRTMPNTPVLVGAGVAGICAGACASASDLDAAAALFEGSARVFRFEEASLDAVTALSGSGPAYAFYLAEGLADAAAGMGIPAGTAREMIALVLSGAGRMLERTQDSPEALRLRVTSPGGTTEAATKHLDAAGVKISISEAVRRAEARARELGRT